VQQQVGRKWKRILLLPSWSSLRGAAAARLAGRAGDPAAAGWLAGWLAGGGKARVLPCTRADWRGGRLTGQLRRARGTASWAVGVADEVGGWLPRGSYTVHFI
jgi:hypothetical protein